MPLNSNPLDCSPLLIDFEIEIADENKLAQYIGEIMLGEYLHIQHIINSIESTDPITTNHVIDYTIEKLKKNDKIDLDKRDGWIFQIISWIALCKAHSHEKYYCQQPHDAPAQHGIDGLAVILDHNNRISKIIICEDKCSTNPRVVIPQQVWPEFTQYETGEYDNKLVSRISAMLANLDSGKIFQANKNDIFQKELRRYRIAINRDSSYDGVDKRKKLFKGYDDCVKDTHHGRRTGSTLRNEDIRTWMNLITIKIIDYLISKRQ